MGIVGRISLKRSCIRIQRCRKVSRSPGFVLRISQERRTSSASSMPLVFTEPCMSGLALKVMYGSKVEKKFVAMKFMSKRRSSPSR